MLRNEFYSSKLDSVETDLDEWILNMEELWIQMSTCGVKGNISNEDLMVHAKNKLPEAHDMILDGWLMKSWNAGLKKYKQKWKEKIKKRHW